MGFAKYHEDNIEMWEERNRYRRNPVARMNSHPLGTSVQTKNKSTHDSSQSSSKPQRNNRSQRLVATSATQ